VPFLSSAQNITSVNWMASSPISQSSVGLNALLTSPGCPTPFTWKIEYGFPSGYQGSQGNFSITGENIVGYGPTMQGSQMTANWINTGTQQACQSPSSFATTIANLYPAHTYYFRFVECQGNTCIPVLSPAYVATTEPATSVNIGFGTSPDFGDFVSVTPTGSFTPASLAGLQVKIYVFDQSVDGISLDDAVGLAINQHSRQFAPDGRVMFAQSGLTPGQTYYLRIMTDAPGVGGGNNLFSGDLPITIPVDSGSGSGNQNGVSGGTNPGFPASGEEFNQGLITCDGVIVPCTFEKLLIMVNKVIRFLIFVIGVPIVTLSFAYAGFVLLTSGGNPSKKDEAKGIIKNATIGLIILLAAWLIVRTVLVILGYTGPLLEIMGA